MEVWVLSHGYDYGDVYDKYKWSDEVRFLGAYYTREEGLAALEKYKKIKGFCSHLDGFWLEKHSLDKYAAWEGGYVTYYKENNVEIDKSENQKLYVLSHFYYIDKDKIKEEHRILSVCLSKSEARKKIKEYQKVKGFCSHISNFYIEEYILDEEKNK